MKRPTDADHRAAEALTPDDTRVYLPPAVDRFPALNLDNAKPRDPKRIDWPVVTAWFAVLCVGWGAAGAIAVWVLS